MTLTSVKHLHSPAPPENPQLAKSREPTDAAMNTNNTTTPSTDFMERSRALMGERLKAVQDGSVISPMMAKDDHFEVLRIKAPRSANVARMRAGGPPHRPKAARSCTRRPLRPGHCRLAGRRLRPPTWRTR